MKNVILFAILGILLVVLAVQAIQLSSLKEKVSSGFTLSSETSTPAASSNSNTVVNSPSASPQMVGGC